MWDLAIKYTIVSVIIYILLKIFSGEPNRIKFYFYFFMFYFLTSIVAVIALPYFLLHPRDVKNVKIVSGILKHITKIYNLKWEVRNPEILSEERGAVIVCNHQSSLDVLGMFNIWQIAGKMTVIAKKEILYVQPFGLAAYLAGIIFINRRNMKGSINKLDVATETMVNHKTKVWLFPEGTRNKDYTKLLPFKKGAFVMAVRAQVPIIPILFSPYYFINRKKHVFNKGHVIIKCLEPVPTKGLTLDDVPDLIEKVYGVMQKSYMELSKEVLNALPADYPHTTVG